MTVNPISQYSLDKQILYLLKMIFAKHIQTAVAKRNPEPV